MTIRHAQTFCTVSPWDTHRKPSQMPSRAFVSKIDPGLLCHIETDTIGAVHSLTMQAEETMGFTFKQPVAVASAHEMAWQDGYQAAAREAEGMMQCMRLGSALVTAALHWVPPPTAFGEPQTLERALYELRQESPHLEWREHKGWARATDDWFEYTGIPEYSNGKAVGWCFSIDVYNHTALGTGQKCLKFVSGATSKPGGRKLYRYATHALSDARQQLQACMNDILGASEGEG